MRNLKLIATFVAGLSVTIFAAYAATIEADINSFTQYIQNFLVTSDGTPNGTGFVNIDWEGQSLTINKDDLHFIFNDMLPFNAAGSLYADEDMLLFNGITDNNGPMSVAIANNSNDERVGISTRVEEDNNILAMMEYESSSNQDMQTQIQHQLRVQADGTTISFDDYDVLWQNIKLWIGALWLYVSSSLGGNILQIAQDGTIWFKNYSFPINDGQTNQVLTTDGNGQLSRTDVSWGGGWAGVSSLNGQVWDLWLTSDDITQGDENQFVVTKRITLTANQILNLHTTPIQALPAPWEDKIITILDIFARFNPETTPYTPTGFANLAVYYTDQDPAQALKTNFDFLENTTEFVQKLSPWCFGNCAIDMNNKWLSIWYEAGASVSGGDGTVDLYISYKILDLNMPVD